MMDKAKPGNKPQGSVKTPEKRNKRKRGERSKVSKNEESMKEESEEKVEYENEHETFKRNLRNRQNVKK